MNFFMAKVTMFVSFHQFIDNSYEKSITSFILSAFLPSIITYTWYACLNKVDVTYKIHQQKTNIATEIDRVFVCDHTEI